ncbi:hypothetical protein Y025_5178 [Burkholderia pseudomallei TSV32]|nr:hypothetical protein Y025_5178 [Burkholderia pseudomallei TSV32]
MASRRWKRRTCPVNARTSADAQAASHPAGGRNTACVLLYLVILFLDNN